MYVFVMPNQAAKEHEPAPRLRLLPDHLNADVQDLVSHEVARREKYNRGFFAKLFGKQTTDRAAVLADLKSARVMDDDRYFLASMSRRRVKEVL